MRPRTIYTITAKGRRSLASWLKVPGDGPVLEFEQLTKIFLADQGRKEDALATIAAARSWAASLMTGFADAARPYARGEGAFPDRLAPNMVVGRFLLDFYEMVYRWAQWASTVVAAWPDDVEGAEPEWSVLDTIILRGDEMRDEAARYAEHERRSTRRRSRTARPGKMGERSPKRGLGNE
jgi:hypothetical protein